MSLSKSNIPEIINRLKWLLNDSNVNDYSKIFIKDIVGDLEQVINDKKNLIVDWLIEYKKKNLCYSNNNYGDCLDCIATDKCSAIQAVTNLIITGELPKQRSINENNQNN